MYIHINDTYIYIFIYLLLFYYIHSYMIFCYYYNSIIILLSLFVLLLLYIYILFLLYVCVCSDHKDGGWPHDHTFRAILGSAASRAMVAPGYLCRAAIDDSGRWSWEIPNGGARC